MAYIDYFDPKSYEKSPLSPTIELDLPDLNLAEATNIGVDTGREVTGINTQRLIDPKEDISKDFKIFSKRNGFSNDIKHGSYESMIEAVGIKDRSGFFSKKGMTLAGAIAGAAGSSILAIAGARPVEGPTGQSIASLGFIDEFNLKKHFENFNAVNAKIRNEAGPKNYGGRSKSFNPNKTSYGFAGVINGHHFSRHPNHSAYTGLKSALSSEDHNAHMMLKSMEALSYGLDPRGYRLDGQNEDNKGVTVATASGMGGITEDGYFTYVANNGYGHSKSVLYGGSQMSVDLAKSLGVSKNTMIDAMGLARSNKNLTFTQALNQLTGGKFNNVSAASTNTTVIKKTTFGSTVVGGTISNNINEDPKPVQEEKDDNKINTVFMGGSEAGFGTADYVPGGMNLGGDVEARVLEDTNQLSDEQINVQEMGFVGDKTPDQVSEQQSIADDQPRDLRSGDFIINSPAIEGTGVRNVVNMMKRGLRDAAESGVEIVDLPPDIPDNEMAEVLLSQSEFRVPKNLIPFVGRATLERLNNSGKAEVTKRAEQMDKEMKQLGPQQVKSGGTITIQRRTTLS